jgi:hypothetical protein
VDKAPLAQGRDPIVAADHGSSKGVAMAADVLRERVHHVVGAERQRLGTEWSGNGRIDREFGPSCTDNLGDGGNVGQAQDGIGRCLNVNELGVRPHRCGYGLRLRGIDWSDSDAVLGQDIMGEFRHTCIANIRHNQVISAGQPVKEQGADRRHAAGEAERRLATLECREAGFQQRKGRIAPAGVEVWCGLIEVVG